MSARSDEDSRRNAEDAHRQRQWLILSAVAAMVGIVATGALLQWGQAELRRRRAAEARITETVALAETVAEVADRKLKRLAGAVDARRRAPVRGDRLIEGPPERPMTTLG